MTEKDKQLPNNTEQQDPPQADSKRGYDLANRAGADLAKKHAARIVRIDKAFQPTAGLIAIAKSMQDSGYSKMLASMAEFRPMLKPPVGGWAQLKLPVAVWEQEHAARMTAIDKAFQPMMASSAMAKLFHNSSYFKVKGFAPMAEFRPMLKPPVGGWAQLKLPVAVWEQGHADRAVGMSSIEFMAGYNAMVKTLHDQHDQISRIEKMVGSLSVHNSDFTEVQEAFQEVNNLTESVLHSAAADNRAISEKDSDELAKKIAMMINQNSILIAAFFFVLGLILQPIIGYEVKQHIETDKNNWKRAVDNVQIQDRELLRPYRIVTADVLNVRQSASAKSPIMGQLHYGDVVQVVEKRRSWSFIIWRDIDSDSLIQGWVFTRYIKPLK